MIEALFNQPNYLATKKLLDATVLRQTAISSNLANLETPKYQRVDLAPSFREALSHAVAGSAPNEIQSVTPKLAVDPNAVAHGRDGNTVQLENEMMQMNQNTLENAVGSRLVTSSLVRLRMAITGHA
jgi:flagellar basal-body rod protein FlgB